MTPGDALSRDRERLRATLNNYASDDLERMLERYSPGAGAGRRRAERVEQLALILSDSRFARRAVAELSAAQLRPLRIVQRYGRASVAALNLAGDRAPNGVYAAPEVLELLLARGLLLLEARECSRLTSYDISGLAGPHQWVWAPHAVLEALPPPPEISAQSCAARDPARVETATFPLVRRDLYVMLRLLRSRGVRLTRTGEVHRTDLRKLMQAIEPAPGTPPRDIAERRLTGRVTFMLRLLMQAGLAAAEGDALRGSEAATALIGAPEASAARLMFESWLDMEWDEFQRIPGLTPEPWYYSGAVDVPSQPRLARARASVIALLERFVSGAAGDSWLDLRALAEQMRETNPEFLISRIDDALLPGLEQAPGPATLGYYQDQQLKEQRYYHGFVRREARGPERRLRKDRDWLDVEGAFIEQVVAESLHWLGLVDVGFDRDSDRPVAVRISAPFRHILRGPHESAERTMVGRALVVQPNLEVLVLDALARLDLLAELDGFAEPRTLDRAAVYALTRSAFVRGLGAGWTQERVVGLLEAASGEPVPQNVYRALQDWAREFERVHVHRSATLLEADDSAALDDWLASPAFSRAQSRRLSPTVALLQPLEPGHIPALLAAHEDLLRLVDYRLDPAAIFDIPAPGQIVVPRQVLEPYLDYRLVAFADRESSDAGEVARYVISRDSLTRARTAGLAIDEILAFLRFKSRLPLSPDDVLTLRGWSGYHAPFRYAKVRAVELPPTATWGELGRVKALQACIVRVLSPYLALVAEEHWDDFRAELAARGVELRAELPKQRASERRLLAHEERPSNLDRISPRRLLDELGRGPSRTTRLKRLVGRALTEFIERALDDKAPLLIEYRLRNERKPRVRVVEPHELEVREGVYYLHAYCRLRREERDFRVSNIRGVALA